MPTRLRGPCTAPGCPQRQAPGGRGYCAEHRREADRRYDELRGTPAQRGYGSRWKRARLAWLRASPLCAACLERGAVVPGQVVDHIVPHRGDRELFWDRGNWQTLCERCHNAKTARGE